MEHLYPLFSDQPVLSNAAAGHQEQAFQLLEEATSAASGGPLEHRLLAAQSWVVLSIEWSHASSLDAYRKSLELLQVVISTGSSLGPLYHRLTSAVRLKGTQDLAVDAAACAIRAGRIEMALNYWNKVGVSSSHKQGDIGRQLTIWRSLNQIWPTSSGEPAP